MFCFVFWVFWGFFREKYTFLIALTITFHLVFVLNVNLIFNTLENMALRTNWWVKQTPVTLEKSNR